MIKIAKYFQVTVDYLIGNYIENNLEEKIIEVAFSELSLNDKIFIAEQIANIMKISILNNLGSKN